jgi:hypothetical protein
VRPEFLLDALDTLEMKKGSVACLDLVTVSTKLSRLQISVVSSSSSSSFYSLSYDRSIAPFKAKSPEYDIV